MIKPTLILSFSLYLLLLTPLGCTPEERTVSTETGGDSQFNGGSLTGGFDSLGGNMGEASGGSLGGEWGGSMGGESNSIIPMNRQDDESDLLFEPNRLLRVEITLPQEEWDELRSFQTALQNINYLETIYG